MAVDKPRQGLKERFYNNIILEKRYILLWVGLNHPAHSLHCLHWEHPDRGRHLLPAHEPQKDPSPDGFRLYFIFQGHSTGCSFDADVLRGLCFNKNDRCYCIGNHFFHDLRGLRVGNVPFCHPIRSLGQTEAGIALDSAR